MYDTAVTIRRSTCAHVWKMVKRVWWQWNSSRRCPMICMRLAASARAWCRISETPTTCEAPTLCETPTMCETPLLLLIIIIKKVIYRYIYRAQEGAAFRLEGQDGGGAGLIRRGRRDTWLCRPPATLHLMYDTSVTILVYDTAVTSRRSTCALMVWICAEVKGLGLVLQGESRCLYVYVYLYIYIYTYIHIDICICIYVCISVSKPC